MIGPLLLVIGLLGLWALAKGKAGPVLDALTQTGFSTSLDNALGAINLSTNSTTGTSTGTSSGAGVASSASNTSTDSGSHQALVNGVVVTIDKTYAQMTNAEKDAANLFANTIGNVNA